LSFLFAGSSFFATASSFPFAASSFPPAGSTSGASDHPFRPTGPTRNRFHPSVACARPGIELPRAPFRPAGPGGVPHGTL
jgi:hypothetical protein